jgi:hypothetical protein
VIPIPKIRGETSDSVLNLFLESRTARNA